MSTTKREPKWKEKFLEWQASGKSVRAWCSEQQIPVTTFYGWKSRLKKLSINQHQTKPKKSSQRLEAPRGFIELADKKPVGTGIIIECDGVKIHLLSAFDSSVLKQCIACLRGAAC